MFEAISWGAVLRVSQSITQAAPFILTGFIIAAVFRRLIGYENLRKLFGDGTWRSLPQAWGVGMLLPVCSLGVIPVMREMRRAGLSGGTILAFGLTAPLFNPISVLYGLTLSEPFTIFSFMIASLAVVTVIGVFFDRFFPGSAIEAEVQKNVPFGIKRIISVFETMGREILSYSTLYILIGLLGVVLLNVILPRASFQNSVNGGNIYAPLFMTGVAVPAYATPMLAMSQLGMMFQHGNSVGAAFTLLILGAGLNFGIIAWMFINYGIKRSSYWMVVLLGVVLLLGYALEKPLFPADIEIANHTHAFDIYCCPFSPGPHNYLTEIQKKLSDDVRAEEIFSLIALAVSGFLGLIFILIRSKWDFESWITKEQTSKADIVLPNWSLGGVAIIGLIIVSISMCFAYYPDSEECLKEMSIIKTETLSGASSGNYKNAEHWLPIWEDWNRRLQVGVYLRTGSLSEYRRMKSLVVREYLELLEHAMEDDEKEKVQKYRFKLMKAYARLRHAYREESETLN